MWVITCYSVEDAERIQCHIEAMTDYRSVMNERAVMVRVNDEGLRRILEGGDGRTLWRDRVDHTTPIYREPR